MDWSISIVGVGFNVIFLLSVTELLNVVAEVGSKCQSASVNEFIDVSVVMPVESITMEVANSLIISINTVAVVTIGSEVTIREAVV